VADELFNLLVFSVRLGATHYLLTLQCSHECCDHMSAKLESLTRMSRWLHPACL
jgi:hypothetical protein